MSGEKRIPIPAFVVKAYLHHHAAEAQLSQARSIYGRALEDWEDMFVGTEDEFHIAVGTMLSMYRAKLETVLVIEASEEEEGAR